MCVRAHSLVSIVVLRHKAADVLDILHFISRRLILLLLSHSWFLDFSSGELESVGSVGVSSSAGSKSISPRHSLLRCCQKPKRRIRPTSMQFTDTPLISNANSRAMYIQLLYISHSMMAKHDMSYQKLLSIRFMLSYNYCNL